MHRRWDLTDLTADLGDTVHSASLPPTKVTDTKASQFDPLKMKETKPMVSLFFLFSFLGDSVHPGH